MKPEPRFGKADFRSSFVKILANTAVLAAFLPRLNKNPLFPKSATAKAERFRGIFVLIGRSNALCLARTSKAKSTEISRFAAGSGFTAHPTVRCLARTGKAKSTERPRFTAGSGFTAHPNRIRAIEKKDNRYP